MGEDEKEKDKWSFVEEGKEHDIDYYERPKEDKHVYRFNKTSFSKKEKFLIYSITFLVLFSVFIFLNGFDFLYDLNILQSKPIVSDDLIESSILTKTEYGLNEPIEFSNLGLSGFCDVYISGPDKSFYYVDRYNCSEMTQLHLNNSEKGQYTLMIESEGSIETAQFSRK